jgi:adenylate kinase
LKSVLENNAEKTSKGVIFDGFPRTIPQAQALNALLKEYNTEIHAVVGLEVADDELVTRLINRGKQSGRSDDNLETITKRLEVYHNQTSPLRDFYVNEGKYRAIQGVGKVEEIFNTISNAIDAIA